MNRPIREVLPDLPKGAPPIIEPDRFEIAADGVYLLKEKENIIEKINIICWPLIIIGRYRDIDDRYVLFRLAWRDEEGWDTAIVDRCQVLDRNKIIPALTPLGAPVSSKKCSRRRMVP